METGERPAIEAGYGVGKTDAAYATGEIAQQAVSSIRRHPLEVAERRHTEKEMQWREARLTALRELGQALARLAEPDEIARTVYANLGRVLDQRNLYLALYDEAQHSLSFPLYALEGELHTIPSRPFGNGLPENVVLTQTPLFLNNEVAETLDRLGIDKPEPLPQSLIAVPLITGERVLGVLALRDYGKPNAYSLADLELLSTIAGQAAAALENARLFAAIQQELAERQRAEEALALERNLLRTLIDTVPDYLYVKDTRGRFLAANIATAQIMRADTPDDLLGKSDYDFYPEQLAAEFRADEQEILRSGKPWVDKDEPHLDPHGNRRAVLTTKVPFRDAGGKIAGLVGIGHDITDRKRAQETLDREHTLLSTLMDNIPDYIYFKDLQSRFIRTNRAHAKVFGLSDPAEAIGKTDFDFFTEEHAQAAYEDEQEIIRTGLPTVGRVEKETWPDHPDTWASTTKMPLRDEKGNIVGTAGISRDVTELRRAEEARRLDSLIMANMVDGVCLIRASDGIIVHTNPQFEQMFGYAPGELIGKHVSVVNAPTDKSPEETAKEIMQALEKSDVWTGEVHNLRKDGTPFWCEASVSTFTHSEYGRVWVSVHQDITERKRAEEQLLHNAFYDALTGLPNRALFLDRLGHALERAKRAHVSGFAVLFLDLDRFKLVNDSLGHALGDQLLIATAHRLEMCLRGADTVARLGGDEFVILLEDITSLDEVKRVPERIERELALPFDLEGHRVFSSASIGIVPSVIGYARPEEVLRDADIAMYRAKMAGRARSQVFDRTMRDDAMARLDWETDLRSAVERHEFRVHYQPIVVLERSKIIGFEALVRWEHPTRGLITPENFISLAEETGLIIPIGEWVLREACGQLREWQTAFPLVPPLTISVNLSAKQFTHPELGGQIEQILADTGLDPGSLRLEITESVIMDDCESARNMFQRLKALGVQVQIDDFGTGYSSLSYLQQFAVATLKIDRSFINRMPVDGKGSDIVRMIVRLAHEMGLEVTAEGVETRQQLAQLREFGCEFGQGYLFSRPLEPKAAAALLALPPPP